MKGQSKILSAFIFLLPAMLFAAEAMYRPAAIAPPQPAREFRGAWLVTVANKDWPSRPGLPVAQQKAELAELLDRAAQLKLNAIIFQVRPSCDAMYASSIEPWSEYLTGVMGKAPEPFYDPLAFAIEEAHKRGLELHAWFNPFRAVHAQAKSPVAPNHISKTHPEFVRQYGGQLWLDPGEPLVRQYVLRVVMDVVKRYDVDGVQFDDYFYPFEKDAAGRVADFPDYGTWEKYGLPYRMERGEWRRQNINQFIQGVYQSIKAAKPWVKFGISPFGIWRPMNPPQIRGMDAYATLYADSRRWFASGWVDYFSPQLYWSMDSPQQSFPVLLDWWSRQNAQGRHLWPGLSAANADDKWGAGEMARQIAAVRRQPGAGGEIFYHLRNLTDNAALANAVRAAGAQPALVPASPWLDSMPPGKPKLTVVEDSRSVLRLQWQAADSPAWLWVLQYRTNQVWTTEILSGVRTNWAFARPAPDAISISAVDRVENAGAPTVLKKYVRVPAGKGTYIWK